MATTKTWVVRDNIGRAAEYIVNPKKTTLSDLKQVLMYASDEDKTLLENEKDDSVMLVTGVNCNRETAAQEMRMVQERFSKTAGNVAYHAYQSFKTGEVTPELAHKVGVETARRMWGDQYQVLVATHLNTGTYHNHFVVNAVGMWTGKKYNCNIGAYYHFRALSDEICRDYGLSVIKNPTGKTPRSIYFAEKNGAPTRHNLMRQAIDEAISMSIGSYQFIQLMREKGYVVKIDFNHKYATIRSVNSEKSLRTYRLGEDYDRSAIFRRIKENSEHHYSETMQRYQDYADRVRFKPFQTKQYRLRGSLKTAKKITGLYALYLHYCYLLGYIPKNRKHTPLSPEMREAMCKIDRTTQQVTLISHEHLKTEEDVRAFISTTDKQIDLLIEARSKVRNKLRNCKDPELISSYKEKRDDYTAALMQLRKDKKTAQRITDDVPEIKRNIGYEERMRQGRSAPDKNRKRGYER